MKENLSLMKQSFLFYLSFLSPSYISELVSKAKTMTPMEIFLTILMSSFWVLYGCGFCILKVFFGFGHLLIYLMRGMEKAGAVQKKTPEEKTAKNAAITGSTS